MNDDPNAVYGVSLEGPIQAITPPVLPYRPRDPKHYRPGIGFIGCGGVSEHQLNAYRNAGYNVLALCDIDPAKARSRQQEFFPEADVCCHYTEVLDRKDIDVVDLATHPSVRAPMIEAALLAGKHVLSQKPFVLDLDIGRRLADLADRQGLKLAVNQNGRWAPHFSYIRHAIEGGFIGEVSSVDFEVHWDHNWVAGLEFDKMEHLLFYDFAIHWFDAATVFFDANRAQKIYAVTARARGQRAHPPLLGHAAIEYENGQATFMFNGNCCIGQRDITSVIGTKGVLRSHGPDLLHQEVTLQTAEGLGTVGLQGSWFPDGMHGAMAELLCAIEEDREPIHSARNNFSSLEVCFAAIASSISGEPKRPGDVTRMIL
ncbi:MAG: Gfo/Idh/MocA family oxidoreductase [Opitutales bacterium]